MRVGLLTTSFPRFEGDIAGNFVLGFARALSEQGHQVRVLAPEPARVDAGRPDFSPVTLRWVPYLRPRSLERTFYGAGVLDNLRRDPRAFLGLGPFTLGLGVAAAREVHGWDALVSHWALPCALVAGALRGGRPHLAVLHSADVALLERLPLRRELARRIARGASALLFSSRNLRSRFGALLEPVERSEHSGRMHVCAMGIEPAAEPPSTAARQELRRALGLQRFTVLSLSRLVPIKGLEHAIEAVRALPGAELVIAGDGPERAALERKARALSAPVRFVGHVLGPQKEVWLAAADAFVLPSIELASGRTEGMPTSLLEAMQAGLPVIASKSGGTPDLIEPGINGFLVPPGQSAELARVLGTLQGDAQLRARMSREARETAAVYEWPQLAPYLSQLLTGADPA
ncbi:MAG: glycosyltransferase family 4 protein [Myxococcales bacterium]